MTGALARQLMSIGDALSILKTDFPDLTISKLRYLETEGLVEPQRTSSGYRKYSHADVQRLHFVLSVQRDQYLPLKVIKDQLEAMDRGLEPSPQGGARAPRGLVSVDSLPKGEVFGPGAKLKLSASELLEAAGATNEVLASCQSFGLIPSDGSLFDADDVAVLKTVVALADYGIEPRHLRGFKLAADRELGLVEQVVAPIRGQKDPEAKDRAIEVAREVASLSASLHIALVRAGLGEA